MIRALPHCSDCGHVVSIAPDADGRFSVWCACASTSPTDPGYRGVGHGVNEAAALSAWENWKPDDDQA